MYVRVCVPVVDELHGGGERAAREGGAELHVVLARRLPLRADVEVLLLRLHIAPTYIVVVVATWIVL